MSVFARQNKVRRFPGWHLRLKRILHVTVSHVLWSCSSFAVNMLSFMNSTKEVVSSPTNFVVFASSTTCTAAQTFSVTGWRKVGLLHIHNFLTIFSTLLSPNAAVHGFLVTNLPFDVLDAPTEAIRNTRKSSSKEAYSTPLISNIENVSALRNTFPF